MSCILLASSKFGVKPDSIILLLPLWLIATVALYLLGNPPSAPAVFPDELCRLGWARLLSNTGPHYQMGLGGYCQPTYSLFLAVLKWMTQDPAELYRATFLLNSSLAAACLPLAIRLSVQHFRLDWGPALVCGLAILAYPSLTLYSYHAWPETALYPAVLLAFMAWCNWVDSPRWRQFILLFAIGIGLYALHRKMLVIPLVLLGGVIIGYWFESTVEYRKRALLSMLAFAVFLLLDDFVKTTAMSAYWESGDVQIIDRFAKLSSFEFAQNVIGKSAGILVYASIVTGGLVWVVLADGLNSILSGARDRFRSLNQFQKKAAFPAVLVILLILKTAFFLGASPRLDTWFYGRHVDPALAVSLLPAVSMIWTQRISWSVIATAALLAMTVFAILANTIPGPPWLDFSSIHVIGAGAFVESLAQLQTRWALLAWCAAALSVTAAICLVRLPGLFRLAAIGPFAVITLVTHLTTMPFTGVPVDEAFPKSATVALRKAERCHVVWNRGVQGRLRVHQFFRLQYYFPNCTIESAIPDPCSAPDYMIITLEHFTDCAPEMQAHPIHPDLILYQ